MRVAIRVDASTQIGSGHVMRCATLADCLKARGAEVVFLCRELPGHYCDWLESREHEVRRLPAASKLYQELPTGGLAHSAWLGVPLRQEVSEATEALAGAGKFDWLVVDHYALNAAWETAMRSVATNIMVIDDLADRNHDADILLDQNLPADQARYDACVGTTCIRLIGPAFALLRPEFARLRSDLSPREKGIRRLLVFLGAGDVRNVTGKVLDAISAAALRGVAVDVVMGQTSPHLDSVRAACQMMSDCEIHVQTNDMASLMAKADLMIGGAGSTTWERFCLGLPAITVSIAANQERVAIETARCRAGIYLGGDESLAADQIASALSRLASRPGLVRRMGYRALAMVDGVGAERVASILLGNSDSDGELLWLRPATPVDAAFAHSVRNDPEVYRYFFSPQPVNWAEHLDWFSRAITQTGRSILIAEDRSGCVGIVRLDQDEENAEVSLSLHPSQFGRKLGSRVLRLTTAWVRQYLSGIKQLTASIHPENGASIKAFEKAGFGERYRCYSYEIEPGRRGQKCH